VLLAALAALSALGSLRLVSEVSRYMDEDSLVLIDGQGHTVSVDEGELAMVWTYAFEAQPTCAVRDPAGDSVGLQPVDGDFRRDAGSAGDLVGTFSFTPRSGTVIVTCDGVDATPASHVAVTTAPSLATGSVGLLALIGAAVVLALLALLAAGLTVAFFLERRQPEGSSRLR
jgi:hypothetical protein